MRKQRNFMVEIADCKDVVRQRHRRLQAIYRALPSHVMVLDRSGTITYVNKPWQQFVHDNRAGIMRVEIGMNYLDVCGQAADRNNSLAGEASLGITALLQGRRSDFTLEYPCHTQTQRRWLLIQASPMPGHYGGAIISHTAITHRNEVERALRESERRYALATTAGGVGVWDWNLETDEMYIDPVLKAILGFEDGEIRNRLDAWRQRVHPDDRLLVADAARDHIEGRTPRYEVEHRMLHKDGRICWFVAQGAVIRRINGAPCRMMGTDTDITALKLAVEAQHMSEARYRLLFEAANEAIFVISETGRILDTNDRACRLFGYTRQELLHMSAPPLESPPISAPEDSLLKDEVDRYGQRVYESVGLRRDSTRIPIEVSTTCITHGGLPLVLAIIRDVSERKKTEEALRKTRDRLQVENASLRAEVVRVNNGSEIIGRSEGIRKMLLEAVQVGDTDTSVLILGETGTGKGLLARAIHAGGKRKHRPLVKVNCSTLPANLIESELFGHEKGAFTGAVANRMGRFELADGGTIFLDEIGELPLDLQTKLLQVLEEGCLERVGSSKTITVDVRIIAATNRDLEELIRARAFRQDLYYRLNVFPIRIPPLRERRNDIPLLVENFVSRIAQKTGKKITSIPEQTMRALQEYPWPGNIRELRNVIERAVIVSQGHTLTIPDELACEVETGVGAQNQTTPNSPCFTTTSPRTLANIERDEIIQILKKTYWRIDGPKGAAKLLGLNPSTLRSRMQKLGIQKPQVEA